MAMVGTIAATTTTATAATAAAAAAAAAAEPVHKSGDGIRDPKAAMDYYGRVLSAVPNNCEAALAIARQHIEEESEEKVCPPPPRACPGLGLGVRAEATEHTLNTRCALAWLLMAP